ncbi:indole-3-glycerol phosphate synthase TrpC [Suttonella ornithocola]|uniref:Indole-3-glycerol phosphate synthase n=1 Tax=Suttonella ornithocola TaxID=279832 RepID=A0A380MXX1_9GAMM|nr:indole-3-glycerol phosphate synthase TrpC [Suttonella ornithocola]SUO97415.1 Indole-3-glycerol phosphate synthase [Suttonella ornithocola]
MTILEDIVAYKRKEVDEQKKFIDEEYLIANIDLSPDQPRGFMRAISERHDSGRVAVIAEIKKASPSAGLIREDFQPKEIALAYAKHQATCLSVLTEKQFFQGSPLHFRQVRNVVDLPMLRKDFIIDRYQVIESRALGADCVLLIAAILTDQEMVAFTRLAYDLGMDVLVEVHNREELDRALALPIKAIGVNNRNLHDFSISLETSLKLYEQLPEDYLLISESGLSSHDDIVALQKAGIHTFLIGGSLMKAEHPGRALQNLIDG